jgi:hypothetical protein
MPFIPWSRTIKEYLLKKDRRGSGNIPRKSRLHYSWNFRHEKALSQKVSQTSQCWSESRSFACFTAHFGPISERSWGPLNHLVAIDDTRIHTYSSETKEQTKEWRQGGSPC